MSWPLQSYIKRDQLIGFNSLYNEPQNLPSTPRRKYSVDSVMAKKAVLIGCNYPGTQAELKGCVNDVRRMYECLVKRYGFSAEDISVLIDTDRSYTQPTGRNIRAALSDLVRSAVPGDSLFVHYSGHGTRLPAVDDDTGYDECIVPTDMNLITGSPFPALFPCICNSIH